MCDKSLTNTPKNKNNFKIHIKGQIMLAFGQICVQNQNKYCITKICITHYCIEKLNKTSICTKKTQNKPVPS